MVFVDTGPFLALHRKRDQYHKEAGGLWETLRMPLVTNNHVIDEVATSLGRAAGYVYAADRVDDIYRSKQLDVISAERADERDAIEWMRKFADQEIGFTDCVSFAMMRRHGIPTAFTFDRHFRLAGFSVVGLRAGAR